MRAVGLFAELDGHDALVDLPSIRDAAGRMDEEVREAVLAHLSHGVVVVDSMESTQDPFHPDQHVAGGSSLVTDGHWVWRLDLAHFVEQYGVDLNPEFIAHTRSRPVVLPEDELFLHWEDAIRAFADARGLG